MTRGRRLDRRAVVKRLLADRGDLLVVSGLGAPSYDVAAAGDHERNFYLWGAMGSAAMLGLGLALAQPAVRVLVVTGDGEMLMGLGAFATIALQKPANLTIVVLDNESYGETGGQASHTAHGVELSAIVKACGIADARVITTMAEVDALAARLRAPSKGPRVATIKIDSADVAKVLPPRDGAWLMARTRGALSFGPI